MAPEQRLYGRSALWDVDLGNNVGGLPPFRFGRPETEETVKTCTVAPQNLDNFMRQECQKRYGKACKQHVEITELNCRSEQGMQLVERVGVFSCGITASTL